MDSRTTTTQSVNVDWPRREWVKESKRISESQIERSLLRTIRVGLYGHTVTNRFFEKNIFFSFFGRPVTLWHFGNVTNVTPYKKIHSFLFYFISSTFILFNLQKMILLYCNEEYWYFQARSAGIKMKNGLVLEQLDVIGIFILLYTSPIKSSI